MKAVFDLLPESIRHLWTTTQTFLLGRFGDEWAEVFRDVTSSYAERVWDLPASERSHHVFPFGLLAHSLDVMARVAETSLTIYGPLLGLLHDSGRVFDLQVFHQQDGEIWAPLLEPLVLFSHRGPHSVIWRPGRGLVRHENAGLSLLQVIVPPKLRDELADNLDFAYTAYCRRHDPKAPLYDNELLDQIGEVQRADSLSAAADRMRHRGENSPLEQRASPCAKGGRRLKNKRGPWGNPFGAMTRTPENALEPGKNPNGL